MSSDSVLSCRMLTTVCQNCGHQYEFPADIFGLARITCPSCSSRLYIRTGRVVKHIQGFHTERTDSENPADWQLGDFAEVILSSGSARNFDIIPFMEALTKLPEWPDIDYMDSKRRKATDMSIVTCLKSTPLVEQPYQLAKIFNRLIGVFKRADNFGCSHLSSYITFLKEGSIPKGEKNKRPAPISDEDFVYEGMIDDEGRAVGLNVPITIQGKRFILTGGFDKKKAAYEADIVSAGGIICSTVSKADYLVIGIPGSEKISRKARDAQRYGVLAVSMNALKNALPSPPPAEDN